MTPVKALETILDMYCDCTNPEKYRDDVKRTALTGLIGKTDDAQPSAHSSHATLIAELAAERAKVKKLREALKASTCDGVCFCGDWLAVPRGKKCHYCMAQTALAETAE